MMNASPITQLTEHAAQAFANVQATRDAAAKVAAAAAAGRQQPAQAKTGA